MQVYNNVKTVLSLIVGESGKYLLNRRTGIITPVPDYGSTIMPHVIGQRYITRTGNEIRLATKGNVTTVMQVDGKIAAVIQDDVLALHNNKLLWYKNKQKQKSIPLQKNFAKEPELISNKLPYTVNPLRYNTRIPVHDNGQVTLLHLQGLTDSQIKNVTRTNIPAPTWMIPMFNADADASSTFLFYNEESKRGHLLRFITGTEYKLSEFDLDVKDVVVNKGACFLLDQGGGVHVVGYVERLPYVGIGYTRYKKLDTRIIETPIRLRFRKGAKIKSMIPVQIGPRGVDSEAHGADKHTGVFFVSEDNRVFGVGSKMLFPDMPSYDPESPREVEIPGSVEDIGDIMEIFVPSTDRTRVAIAGTKGFYADLTSKQTINSLLGLAKIDSQRVIPYTSKLMSHLCK